MRKKIFILGGTGFIGSELLNVLREHKEDYEVFLLGHRNVPFRELEDFNLYLGSLESFDLSLLEKIRPDIIIHMARIPGKKKLGRLLSAKKGARANQRIINSLKEKNLSPHIFYVSGTLVYGDCGDELADESNPISPTAFAKEYIIAEKPWMESLEDKSLPITILRPPWILGHKSWFRHFHLNFISKYGSVPVFGSGDNWMSILDVRDCAGLIFHALNNATTNNYYNLGIPGYFIKQTEFAKTLAQLTNLDMIKLPKQKVVKMFDKTIYEAFSFSLKSNSIHGKFLNSYSFEYPDLKTMLVKNLPST